MVVILCWISLKGVNALKRKMIIFVRKSLIRERINSTNMKKYCLISFVSILFIGGLFVTSKLIVNDSYVLFNANVEALSNEESSLGILTCHNDYFYKEGYSVRDCGNCSMQYDHKASFWALPDICKK